MCYVCDCVQCIACVCVCARLGVCVCVCMFVYVGMFALGVVCMCVRVLCVHGCVCCAVFRVTVHVIVTSVIIAQSIRDVD